VVSSRAGAGSSEAARVREGYVGVFLIGGFGMLGWWPWAGGRHRLSGGVALAWMLAADLGCVSSGSVAGASPTCWPLRCRVRQVALRLFDQWPSLAAGAWLGGSRWAWGLGSPGEIPGWLATAAAMPAGIVPLLEAP
jgi:hypothetical protein